MMGRYLHVLLWLALVGCADLSPIAEGVCGNEVLDPGEDCDTHEDAVLGVGTRCGEAPEAGACRYVCSESALCPLGWDCGPDGVCRQAAGELRAGASTPDWSPDSFQPVDFNGDGQVDLVGAFGDGIEFRRGDPSGTFVDGFVVPTLPVTGSVAVGQLDGDAFGDVLLPTELGFLVWRGQAEGPPLSVAYAAYNSNGAGKLTIVPVSYPPLGPEDSLMVFYEDGSQAGFGVCINGQAGLLGCHVVDEDHDFEEIGERLAVADFDLDGSDEVAMGLAGAGAVKVFGTRFNLVSGQHESGNIDGSSDKPLEVDVSSPRLCADCAEQAAGRTIDRGAHAADIDGDGDPDLIVSMAGRPSVAILLGDGEGHFDAPYFDTRFSLLKSESTVAEGFPGELHGWPLATGDLDDDGAADYVSPNGVFLGRPDALEQVYARETLYPWTAAVVADIDGDGENDVVAIRDGESRVDALLCTNGGSTCKRRLPYATKLPVAALRAASLQGLPATDIVLLERAPAGSQEDDALSVMFGSPFDWPADPVRQARFDSIEHLEIGRLRYPDWPTVDAFDDIVISTRSDGGQLAAGILYGTGTHVLSAPYFAESANALAEGALSGRFTDSESEYDDVVLLGSLAGPRAWWVPGAEDAAFAITEDGEDLRVAFQDPAFQLDCARFAVGDIDGDARDELIGVASTATSQSQLAIGRASDFGTFTFDVQPLSLPGAAGEMQVALADINGDGNDDLMVARTGGVAVAIGGDAGLGPLSPLLELPPNERVLGMTAISRGAGARGVSRVAVLTEASLVVFSGDGSRFEVSSGGATMVRSADIDLDGLGDVLLSADDGVRVLLSVPAAPLGGVL